VRRAVRDDVDALADLALEEHLYHAHHTASGTSPDQPRETSRRIASDAVAADVTTTCQLVAERVSSTDGRAAIVGSIIGSIQMVGDDEIARFLLPARYGYIGLTSVTAAARGSGVGRTLVAELMSWFAAHGCDVVFLHYVNSNRLSQPFWIRMGFTPHLTTFAATV
jgi:ribosomal protein S18 acetylase RimI-like enzyme